MQVELLSYTPDAINLLLRTKNTRLAYEEDPNEWPEEKKKEHLAYMLNTIKSSWEFVDYTFRISGVTRAFTHQLVRTRAGSYAQESQRTVDVRMSPVKTPLSIVGQDKPGRIWQTTLDYIMSAYAILQDEHGIPVQDARGILPTNMTTSIIAKFSLRTLHEMAKVRLCRRTQGEYQTVFRKMREVVLKQHPWAEDFIDVACVYGQCAFPVYGVSECDVWHPSLQWTKDDTTGMKNRFWNSEVKEAVPVARDGKTMK